MTYALFSRLTAQPGRRDDLVAYLLGAGQLLDGDPECYRYIVTTSSEPELVCVFETWTDQRANDASLQREDVRALIEQAGPALAGVPDQIRLTVHGGKAANP